MGCKTLANEWGRSVSAGVPAFFKHLPVVGNALRGISIRAVKRMVEDIERVIVANENGVNLLSSSDTRLEHFSCRLYTFTTYQNYT